MKRSDIQHMPQFFDRYILLVENIDIIEGLQQTANLFHDETVKQALLQLGDQVYAPDKWTAKDILQHIIDNERIMSYRALRFARNDKTSLPGYDEELFGANTTANSRTLDDLLEEFSIVRQSTITLFKSFSDEMFHREGISFNQKISPLALGFVLMGHPIHHLKLLKERYFPLISKL
jgi:DinB superfamily